MGIAMTVKELIDKLNKLDPNTVVCTYDDEWGKYYPAKELFTVYVGKYDTYDDDLIGEVVAYL